MNALLCIALLLQTSPSPAELGDSATGLFLEGHHGQAASVLRELFSRMPHNGRIAYNLAATAFILGSYADADSILGMISGGIEPDTLSTARALSNLALAMDHEDYGGVEAAVEELRGNISPGSSPPCEITGLEAGINWLDDHDPPEDQEQDDQEQEQEQDQEQDDQDQEQDQEQEQDDQEQEQEQEDQEQEQQEQPQPPPSIDEMTPEQAQAILDLVEENLPDDSTGTGKAGVPPGPVW